MNELLTARIQQGYVMATKEVAYNTVKDFRLEPASNPATNEHGQEIGMTWNEVIAAGGTIWVSEDGQPHVDAAFSANH